MMTTTMAALPGDAPDRSRVGTDAIHISRPRGRSARRGPDSLACSALAVERPAACPRSAVGDPSSLRGRAIKAGRPGAARDGYPLSPWFIVGLAPGSLSGVSTEARPAPSVWIGAEDSIDSAEGGPGR